MEKQGLPSSSQINPCFYLLGSIRDGIIEEEDEDEEEEEEEEEEEQPQFNRDQLIERYHVRQV